MSQTIHRLSWTTVLVVACLAIGCGKVSPSQVDAGREIATKFLDELRAGRVDPAWQETTVEFKSLMGSDSLRDYVRAHPGLSGTAEFIDSKPLEATKGRLVEYQFKATPKQPRARLKNPPGPETIRIMIDFGQSPPKVERLKAE